MSSDRRAHPGAPPPGASPPHSSGQPSRPTANCSRAARPRTSRDRILHDGRPARSRDARAAGIRAPGQDALRARLPRRRHRTSPIDVVVTDAWPRKTRTRRSWRRRAAARSPTLSAQRVRVAQLRALERRQEVAALRARRRRAGPDRPPAVRRAARRLAHLRPAMHAVLSAVELRAATDVEQALLDASPSTRSPPRRARRLRPHRDPRLR